jgi:beta-glucosidase
MSQTRMKHFQPEWSHNPTTHRFLFCTGIECSYPTIETPKGRKRIDELEKCGHYEHWREDLELTRDMEIRYLRYGPPYYKIHVGPGRYDWSWTDMVLPEMQKLGIVPIMDLCHFGVPDWLGDFQNPDFPKHFAEYARAFAERYPWVWCYTPVNEMYIAAQFSAYHGWWNERLRSHQAFATALKNLARACLDAMIQIVHAKPEAIFVLCESSEHTHARSPELVDEAEWFNELRFLSLDLVCGRHIHAGMFSYLRDHGMSEDEYLYFLRYNLREHIIIGHDYYPSNEHLVVGPDHRVFAGDLFGYYAVARSYFERYNLPVMHTETHAAGEEDSVRWLWKTWAHVQQLRHDGVPLCGMTWYSLTDQVDWDSLLREERNSVWPIGLYDLNRKIRPVGKAYRDLIRAWHNTPLMPNGPLTVVGSWGSPWTERAKEPKE